MKIGHKIDESGFWTGDVLDGSGVTPHVTVICPDGFHKPKWNGSQWVEGLTAAELEARKNAPKAPFLTDEVAALKKQNANFALIFAKHNMK